MLGDPRNICKEGLRDAGDWIWTYNSLYSVCANTYVRYVDDTLAVYIITVDCTSLSSRFAYTSFDFPIPMELNAWEVPGGVLAHATRTCPSLCSPYTMRCSVDYDVESSNLTRGSSEGLRSSVHGTITSLHMARPTAYMPWYVFCKPCCCFLGLNARSDAFPQEVRTRRHEALPPEAASQLPPRRCMQHYLE